MNMILVKIAGSLESVIKIWTADDACLKIATLQGHSERAHGIAWSPTFQAQRTDSTGVHTIAEDDTVTAKTMVDDSNSIAYSDGPHLATASSDSTVNLWSLKDPGRPSLSLQASVNPFFTSIAGHEDRVNRVAFHPSNRFLASTSQDETWRLWDIATGQELLLQEGHSCGVYPIAMHPDGSLAVTADLGGCIRVWDLRTGRTAIILAGHAKQIMCVDIHDNRPNLVATGSDDNTVRIWDLRKERCLQTLIGHNKLISEVRFEPQEGRYLVSTSFTGDLKLWNTVDWSLLRSFAAHESRIVAGDISQDGARIITASYDRTFKIWSHTDS